MNADFEPCEICGERSWTVVYDGSIRDGVFGNLSYGRIGQCGHCGVERLAEKFCPPASFYESAEYRLKLRAGLESKSYFRTHDELQFYTLEAIWPMDLRESVVADVGCAGGSLLDHVVGISKTQIAIEPSDLYRDDLAKRGYRVYSYCENAESEWSGKIDMAFSNQVIEHVANPREFLAGIGRLLSDKGRLLLSTPNRNDILMTLVPDDFRKFFYRTVHRWYFNAETLSKCVQSAGLEVLKVNHVHRYGMANALAWLRDRKPTGANRMPEIDISADKFWRAYLEQTAQADCLYMTIGRKV